MSNLDMRTHNSIPLRIHDQPPAGLLTESNITSVIETVALTSIVGNPQTLGGETVWAIKIGNAVVLRWQFPVRGVIGPPVSINDPTVLLPASMIPASDVSAPTWGGGTVTVVSPTSVLPGPPPAGSVVLTSVVAGAVPSDPSGTLFYAV